MDKKKKEKSKFQESIYTISFMFIITFVFISVLAFVNISTRDITEQNKKIALQKAILSAGGIKLEDQTKVAKTFEKKARKLVDFNNIYKLDNNYVFITTGAGLWGEIEAVVGFKNDFKTLTGIEFTKQSETPGLGARISESWFKEQMAGVACPINEIIPEGETNKANTIQGITGATITTTAVKDLINKTVKLSTSDILNSKTEAIEQTRSR